MWSRIAFGIFLFIVLGCQCGTTGISGLQEFGSMDFITMPWWKGSIF